MVRRTASRFATRSRVRSSTGSCAPARPNICIARSPSVWRHEAGSDATELAYHWAAAGDVERAVDANERAADLASERNAYRDAAVSYRRALDALPQEGPRFANLCEKLSRSLSIDGRPDGLADVGAASGRGVRRSGPTQTGEPRWRSNSRGVTARRANRSVRRRRPRRALAGSLTCDDEASHGVPLRRLHFARELCRAAGTSATRRRPARGRRAGGADCAAARPSRFPSRAGAVRSMRGPSRSAFEDYEEALRHRAGRGRTTSGLFGR